jgi:hypothetical protein
MQLSSQEVREELKKMAYTQKGFNEVITFVWALPDSFWSRVSKRLIATIIVGVQLDNPCKSIDLPPCYRGAPYAD